MEGGGEGRREGGGREKGERRKRWTRKSLPLNQGRIEGSHFNLSSSFSLQAASDSVSLPLRASQTWRHWPSRASRFTTCLCSSLSLSLSSVSLSAARDCKHKHTLTLIQLYVHPVNVCGSAHCCGCVVNGNVAMAACGVLCIHYMYMYMPRSNHDSIVEAEHIDDIHKTCTCIYMCSIHVVHVHVHVSAT